MAGCLVSIGLYAPALLKIRENGRRQDLIQKISTYVNIQETDDFKKQMETVRLFVNRHSRNNINAEFRSLWRNDLLLYQRFLDTVEGRNADPAPMECSTRSALMARIVEEKLGYRTRSINLFDPHNNMNSHVLIEVLNPGTGRWEAHGPDYATYWRNRENGETISITDVLATQDKAEPCNERDCGWHISSPEGFAVSSLRDYLKIASVIDRKAGRRFSIYAPDIDPAAIYSKDGKQGTFCRLIKKNCRNGFYAAASNQTSPQP